MVGDIFLNSLCPPFFKCVSSALVKILDFRILSGWIKKYKPALSKLDSSWDTSRIYCMRSVIISLALNKSKLQSLVIEDNFFLLSV